MIHWIDALGALADRGEPAVLVTIVAARGSVPRQPGTRMVVGHATVDGTIGGGHLEHQSIALARDLLDARVARGALRRFPLGASLGQCCGGVLELLFEPVAAGASWPGRVRALRREGTPAVLVTPARAGAAGAPTIVTADAGPDPGDRAAGAASGTAAAGDGPAAAATGAPAVLAAARALLADGGGPRLLPQGDGAAWFLDPLRPTDFRVLLFGAGHVARALVHLLAPLECRITWIDERADAFPAEVPANVDVVCTDLPDAEVAAAPAGAFALVMTHSHALDEALAHAILRRGDFAWFGLIGSRSKRRQFEARLARRGVPAAQLATMSCPIGVPGIAGKEPAVIAIAVAAELLQRRALASAVARTPARKAAS